VKVFEYKDGVRTFVVHALDLETAITCFARVHSPLDTSRITEISPEELAANEESAIRLIVEGPVKRPKNRR
jgi:hypothetical protein